MPPNPLLSLKLITSVIAICASAALHAAPTLGGVWQSDEETTYKYNLGRSLMMDKTRDFLHRLGGHEVLTFSKGRLHSFMPDLDLTIEGKLFHMQGWDEVHPFRVLFRNENTIAIETIAFVTHRPVVFVFNFSDPDEFFIYDGEGIKTERFDVHYREYFHRLNSTSQAPVP